MKRFLVLRGTLLVLMFAFFAVLPLVPMLLDGGRLAYGDEIASHFPYHKFVEYMLFNRGEIPFWNPFTYGGVPFFANLQMATAITYPFSILAYWQYNVLFHIFHWTVAITGFYLLLRKLDVSPLSSILAAFLFSLTLVKQSFGMQGAIIAWVPFIFLFSESAANRLKPRFYAGLAGIMFLMLLVWAEFTFYTVFLAFIYFLARMLLLKKDRRFIINSIAAFVGTGFLALGLVAFQALPFLEYSSVSLRGELASNFFSAAHASITPFNLIFLFIPRLFGSQAIPLTHTGSAPYYLGVVVLFSAFFALRNRRTVTLPILAVAIFALLYSLGAYFPLYHLMFRLPPFSKFIAPAKMMFFFLFAVSLLSGFGLDYLFKRTEEPETESRFNRYFFLLAALYILLGTIVYILFWNLDSKLIKIVSGFHPWQLLPLFFMGLLILLYKKKGIATGDKVITIVLLGVAILDFLVVYGLNPYKPYASKKIFEYTPPAVKFLKKDRSLYRMVKIGNPENTGNWTSKKDIKTKAHVNEVKQRLNRLSSNLPLLYRIPEANGYEPLIIKSYGKLVFGFYASSKQTELKASLHELQFPFYNKVLFDLLNIKYLISNSPIKDRDLALVFRDNGNYIYKNKTTLPRAYIATNPIFVDDEEASLKALKRKDFLPGRDVTLIKGNRQTDRVMATEQTVKMVDYQANAIRLKADLNGHGYLIISDSFFPGWTAYVDGEKKPILQANYAFRGIPLEKGAHKIVLKFESRFFRTGIYISLVSLALLLVLLLKDFLGSKADRAPAAPRM